MKKNIFDQYVSEVCKTYDIDIKELFAKTKQNDITEARQMLYYLCHNRRIKNVEIARYVNEYGLSVSAPNVSYSINKMLDIVRGDEDYGHVINKINSCVTP